MNDIILIALGFFLGLWALKAFHTTSHPYPPPKTREIPKKIKESLKKGVVE